MVGFLPSDLAGENIEIPHSGQHFYANSMNIYNDNSNPPRPPSPPPNKNLKEIKLTFLPIMFVVLITRISDTSSDYLANIAYGVSVVVIAIAMFFSSQYIESKINKP